jgi:tetratricopeptide (TPR) repeat protein
MKIAIATLFVQSAALFGTLQMIRAQDVDLRGSYVAVSMAALEQQLSNAKADAASNPASLGFNSFSAAVIQDNPADLILVGAHKGPLPNFSADDLATLAQVSASSVSGDLGISLEAKGGDLRSKKLVPRFIGQTAGNCIGSAAFRADYEMKLMALEKEPSGISSLQSYSSRMKQQLRQLRAANPSSDINILSRFWFTPVYTPALTNDQGNLIVLLPPKIQVDVETLSVNGKAPDGFQDSAADGYAKDFSANWRQLVETHENFADMERFVTAIKLFTILSLEARPDSTVARRLKYWQTTCRPQPVFIPPEVDLIVDSAAGAKEYVIGGVRLGSLTFRMAKQDIGAFREAVLAARQDPKARSWTFSIERDWRITAPGLARDTVEIGRVYGDALSAYDKAFAAADSNLMARALSLAGQVTRACPASPEARLLRAVCGRDLALLEGRLTDALPYLGQLRNLSAELPAFVEPRFEVGKTLLILGRAEEAIPALNEVVQSFPDYAPGQQALGLACRANRDYSAATKHLDLFLKLRAGPPDPLVREAEQALREIGARGAPVSESDEFHSPRHGLRFRVPKTWRRLLPDQIKRIPGVEAAPESVVTVFCQADDPDSNLNIRTDASEADSLSEQDVRDAITMLDAVYPNQFEGFRKLGAGPIHAAGAAGISYTFVSSRASVAMKQTIVTLVKAKTMLTLTFTSKERNFDAMWRQCFQPVLDSLQWTPK